MEQMVFVVIIFCFVNPVYLVGPLFYSENIFLSINGGGYWNNLYSFDFAPDKGYCFLALSDKF